MHPPRRSNTRRAYRLPLYICGCWLSAAPHLMLAGGDTTLMRQTPTPRTSGPLSTSLQQEVLAAMDRGRAWLVAVQNPDGSWGTNGIDRLRLTAMAALALVPSTVPEEVRALERAKRELGALATATNLSDHWEARSWLELALQATRPPDSVRTAAFVQQVYSATFSNAATPFARLLVQAVAPTILIPPYASSGTNTLPATSLIEACLLAMPCGQGTPALGQHAVLTQLAAAWPTSRYPPPPGYTRMQQYWIFAHFINLSGGGSLADASGRLLDWRQDLANELVSAQQIDLQRQGTGFWPSVAPAPSLETATGATVYALLALGEL
jgi:hypothetical protein